jgi:hypothetical protein
MLDQAQEDLMQKAENPSKKHEIRFSSAVIVFAITSFLPVFGDEPANTAFSSTPTRTVLTQNLDFDKSELLSPDYRPSKGVSGFSFLSPNRFSMQQSYSVNFSSGSLGSSSSGLYLNTLSYKLANPLTLSADVGFYSPLYSNSAGKFGSRGIQDPSLGSSLVMPRLGLEYKPTKNTTFSLQLFNGQDAVKAYGYPSPFMNPWTR